MKALIYPYKPGSESSTALAGGLGIKRVAHKNSRFKGNKDTLIINWGASKVSEEVAKCTILNPPQAVALASNKLETFKTLNPPLLKTRKVFVGGMNHDLRLDHDVFDGVADDFVGDIEHPRYGKLRVLERAPAPDNGMVVRTPEFTTNRGEAINWLIKGFTVVERHILNGNSGAGIRLVEPVKPGFEKADENIIQKCPLYVKYVPKKQEYRIHVCGGEAVDIQRKARRKDVADDAINWKVRNHDNGFIFARNEGVPVPPDVIAQATIAVKALGLDFGAVDVIFSDKEQKAYVLEVNTAPGLAGETLAGYVSRFTKYINGEVAPQQQDVPKAFVGDQDIPAGVVPNGFFDIQKGRAEVGEKIEPPKIKRKPIDPAELFGRWAVAPAAVVAEELDDIDGEEF